MNDKIKNFGADHLASLNLNASQANNDEDAEDTDDDSPEALERKAQLRSVRETLNAMSQGRRSQPNQPIRMTCADESDSDSSDASEEDPDTPDSSDTESNDDDATSQSNTSRNRSRKSSSRPNADELGTQIEEPVAQPKKRRALHKPQFADDPENCVRMYTIMECMTKNGREQPPYTRQAFLNYDEAIEAVKELANRYRDNKPSDVNESWDDDLYQGTFTMDKEGENMLDIWLGVDFKSKDMNPADCGMNEIRKLRFFEKTYFVKRTIVRRTTNAETGVERETTEPEILNHWSDIELANNHALELFIKYLKPAGAKIDHVNYHVNKVIPALRKARQDLGWQVPFFVEMDRADGLEWLPVEIISVCFEVDLYKIKGPLN